MIPGGLVVILDDIAVFLWLSWLVAVFDCG